MYQLLKSNINLGKLQTALSFFFCPNEKYHNVTYNANKTVLRLVSPNNESAVGTGVSGDLVLAQATGAGGTEPTSEIRRKAC